MSTSRARRRGTTRPATRPWRGRRASRPPPSQLPPQNEPRPPPPRQPPPPPPQNERPQPQYEARPPARTTPRAEGNGATPASRGGFSRPRRREELRRAQGRQGREPLRAQGRGGGPARAERRRQDHGLLHDHRTDQGRHGRIELDGHDVTAPADVSARPPRHRLPAAGSLDLPRPHGRGQYPRRARGGRAEPPSGARRDLDALLEEFDIAQLRKTPAIALSGGERRRVEIARALATRPASCCSTSRSPASTRSPSATSRRWCAI